MGETLAEDLYPFARRKTVPQPAPQPVNTGSGFRDRAARLLRTA